MGWYPDHQVRLFRRGCVSDWSDATHQAPEVLTGAHRLYLLPLDGLHIHHDNYANLRAVIERQLRYALQDVYNPTAFNADHYAAAAYAEFARRHNPEADGDLSHTMATVTAWIKSCAA